MRTSVPRLSLRLLPTRTACSDSKTFWLSLAPTKAWRTTTAPTNWKLCSRIWSTCRRTPSATSTSSCIRFRCSGRCWDPVSSSRSISYARNVLLKRCGSRIPDQVHSGRCLERRREPHGCDPQRSATPARRTDWTSHGGGVWPRYSAGIALPVGVEGGRLDGCAEGH